MRERGRERMEERVCVLCEREKEREKRVREERKDTVGRRMAGKGKKRENPNEARSDD